MLEYCFIENNSWSRSVQKCVIYASHYWMVYHIWRRDRQKSSIDTPPVQYFGNSGLVSNGLNSSKADMISTGEDALVALYHRYVYIYIYALYKGKPGETLDHLRLQKFQHKIIVKH